MKLQGSKHLARHTTFTTFTSSQHWNQYPIYSLHLCFWFYLSMFVDTFFHNTHGFIPQNLPLLVLKRQYLIKIQQEYKYIIRIGKHHHNNSCSSCVLSKWKVSWSNHRNFLTGKAWIIPWILSIFDSEKIRVWNAFWVHGLFLHWIH